MAQRKMARPNCWKPLTCGYVAAGVFVFQKNAPPHIFGSPQLVGTLPQAFSFRIMAPHFWKPLTCGYVAAGAFVFQKNGAHVFGSPKSRDPKGTLAGSEQI